MKKIFLAVLFVCLSSAAFSQKKTIEVSNANEFLNAIGPDRTIELCSGTYDLSDFAGSSGRYYYYEEVYDGMEFVISEVKNLKIIGTGFLTPEIITRPVYGNVISFSNCSNIEIENIEAGHGIPKGGCTGGVLKFSDCSNIKIKDCILYGSGMEGITCYNVNNLICNNSVIKGCTYGIMTLDNSTLFMFIKCDFFNNVEYDMINLSRCKGIMFVECGIKSNKSGNSDYSNYCLFRLDESTAISVKDCVIINNKTDYLTNDKAELKFINTDVSVNKFSKGTYEQR